MQYLSPDDIAALIARYGPCRIVVGPLLVFRLDTQGWITVGRRFRVAADQISGEQ
jgi:hypothetical protein